MSPINIPLENWLMVTDNSKVTSTECVKILSGDCVKEESISSIMRKQASGQVLVIAELVLAINNVLNTDTLLWPEGIREDFSNIGLFFNSETNEPEFKIILTKEDATEDELVANESNPLLVTFQLRNPVFINNEKPALLNILMQPDVSEALLSGQIPNLKVNDTAPTLRLMLLDDTVVDSLTDYMIKTDLSLIHKVAVCRYFNKVINGLIHEDMIDKIITIKEIVNKNNQSEFFMSIDVYGQVILLTMVYDEDYNPNEEEENFEDA